ncbi:MAG: DUF1896 family protein, partial [Ferruginibacter sp.]
VMIEALQNKLFEYIRDNNPDILFELEAETNVIVWLSEKVNGIEVRIVELQSQGLPEYEIEEICMAELTNDLRPSRYNYILNLLEEEFKDDYNKLLQSGLLQHEVINMINQCDPVFADLKFSEENEDNQFIRYAITGEVSEYLQSNREVETVSNELQQSAETKG